MLHYRIHEHAPDSEWVVFLHGAGGSSTIWYKQIRAFKEDFNVLLIDLRGHGLSKIPWNPQELKRYSFDLLAEDVIQVLDETGVEKAHFVGISLGCILIRQIAERGPERVHSMILGGAILKLNVRSRFLMWLGNVSKNIIPYMLLYKFFAWIILPRKNTGKAGSCSSAKPRKCSRKNFFVGTSSRPTSRAYSSFFGTKTSASPRYISWARKTIYSWLPFGTRSWHMPRPSSWYSQNVAMWSMCSSPCGSTARVCAS